MVRKILTASILAFLVSCKPEPELLTIGDYYIDNTTNDTLIIQVEGINDPVTLEKSLITPNTNVMILQTVQGTGGGVLPSHFFSDFKVFVRHNSEDSLVYRGVRNDDWLQAFISSGHIKSTFRTK